MKLLKKTLKGILLLIALPILYILVSYGLSAITVNKMDLKDNTKTIYLITNGIHIDIVLPKENIDLDLANGLELMDEGKYIAFGWGDENFYLNTPTWDDLTFKNAFGAMLLKSTTLMHLTRYTVPRNNWTKVKIDPNELETLNTYLLNSFELNDVGKKMIIPNAGYGKNDDFYRANGSYSCYNTCNTWANTGFKKAGLKACYWTPFDFALLNKYK